MLVALQYIPKEESRSEDLRIEQGKDHINQVQKLFAKLLYRRLCQFS